MISRNEKIDSWGERIHSQPMFDILGDVRNLERNGVKAIHLEIGDTLGYRNDAIRDCLVRRVSEGDFSYSPSTGEEYLVRTLAERFSRELGELVDPLGIAVAPANFLITQTLAAVSSPGDCVLIPDPGFPTYKLAADFLGLDVVSYSVFQNGRPTLEDISSLKKRLGRRRVRVLILSNPSNPLGHAFSWSELSDLMSMALTNESAVISDETYVNLAVGDVDPGPVKLETPEMVRIRSFSKEHAAPGLRVGYCITTPRIARKVSQFSSLTFSCLPSVIQNAIADYFSRGDADYFLNHIRSDLKTRFQRFDEIMKENRLNHWNSPNAGFYAFLEVGNGNAAYKHLLQQHHVAVCPGGAFGSKGETAIRVSLAGHWPDVARGCGITAKVISEKGTWSE